MLDVPRHGALAKGSPCAPSVAAMRGSFRPPGGRFDMQPPSRGVDITTLADWSESVDAGPKVTPGPRYPGGRNPRVSL